jgi:hypothetical protein
MPKKTTRPPIHADRQAMNDIAELFYLETIVFEFLAKGF